MAKRNQYSTLRPETTEKSPGGLHTFYDGLIKPASLLVIIGGLIAVLGDETWQSFVKAFNGDRAAIVHIALVALTLVVIFRIIQSVFLAKIDYSDLECGYSDIFVFLAVLGLLYKMLSWVKVGNPIASLGALTLLAVVGTINFFRLWKYRIPRYSKKYDYPIEMRIQCVNTLVCAFSASALGYLVWAINTAVPPVCLTVAMVLTVGVAFIFNMVHSQQLTLIPKFLLKNDPDSPKQLIEEFRKIFWRTSKGTPDEAIRQHIAKDIDGFRALRMVRAGRGDAGRIVESLLVEFGYVFRYVFGSGDESKLRPAIATLLLAGGGLGEMGYMNFYMLRHKDEAVGFVKADSCRSCGAYRFVAACSTLFMVARVFGVFKAWGIYRRSKALLATQSAPVPKEIRLTYIVIYPAYRSQGYGSAVMRLLINALIRNKTNDIDADRLTLIVRKGNRAEHLFLRAGFVPADRSSEMGTEPFADDPGIGAAQFLEYKDRTSEEQTPPAGNSSGSKTDSITKAEAPVVSAETVEQHDTVE